MFIYSCKFIFPISPNLLVLGIFSSSYSFSIFPCSILNLSISTTGILALLFLLELNNMCLRTTKDIQGNIPPTNKQKSLCQLYLRFNAHVTCGSTKSTQSLEDWELTSMNWYRRIYISINWIRSHYTEENTFLTHFEYCPLQSR